MNRHIINDGHNTYTRISKYVAKLRFNAGLPFCIIGCNLRPGYPFAQHCTVWDSKQWIYDARYNARWNKEELTDKQINERAWQSFYNNWAYYNLSHSQREEGRYAAYYIETPNKVPSVSVPVQVSQ